MALVKGTINTKCLNKSFHPKYGNGYFQDYILILGLVSDKLGQIKAKENQKALLMKIKKF